MTASAPANAMSRVIPMPKVLWRQEQVCLAKPDETKVYALCAGTNLPQKSMISRLAPGAGNRAGWPQGGDLAMSLSTAVTGRWPLWLRPETRPTLGPAAVNSPLAGHRANGITFHVSAVFTAHAYHRNAALADNGRDAHRPRLATGAILALTGSPERRPPPSGPILSECDGQLRELVLQYEPSAKDIVVPVYRDFLGRARPRRQRSPRLPDRAAFDDFLAAVGPSDAGFRRSCRATP